MSYENFYKDRLISFKVKRRLGIKIMYVYPVPSPVYAGMSSVSLIS